MQHAEIDPVTDVLNQSPVFAPSNAYDVDIALKEAVARGGGEWAEDRLRAAGAGFIKTDLLDLARLANEHRPVLRTHDDQGRRRDEVEFHPAWHSLLDTAIDHGLIALP